MSEKGIFTRDQEKFLSNVIDEALKLKGFLELVDGYVARVVVTVIDDQLVDKLKAELKTQLAVVADAALKGDLNGAEQASADLLNSLVDIPALDEDGEGLIFKGVIELAVGAIKKWIAEKKAA
jgi:hypothetical protein